MHERFVVVGGEIKATGLRVTKCSSMVSIREMAKENSSSRQRTAAVPGWHR